MMAETLYKRLGGRSALVRICNDIVDMHAENPIVGPRFRSVDLDKTKMHA
ncbi:MAG: group 1 truncated hemoglobin, partial [Polyangiaceae bacterium]|nr:group 1 truncated hemoglobin [Polyangiaceae bacterium]